MPNLIQWFSVFFSSYYGIFESAEKKTEIAPRDVL